MRESLECRLARDFCAGWNLEVNAEVGAGEESREGGVRDVARTEGAAAARFDGVGAPGFKSVA